MEILFLTRAELLALHERAIAEYGGLPGVMNEGLLESALNMPQMGTKDGYVHSDLYEMAAAYGYHITKNHAFFEGNKRTGLAATSTFLRMNNLAIDDSDELAELFENLSNSKATKEQLTKYLRKHARAAPIQV